MQRARRHSTAPHGTARQHTEEGHGLVGVAAAPHVDDHEDHALTHDAHREQDRHQLRHARNTTGVTHHRVKQTSGKRRCATRPAVERTYEHDDATNDKHEEVVGGGAGVRAATGRERVRLEHAGVLHAVTHAHGCQPRGDLACPRHGSRADSQEVQLEQEAEPKVSKVNEAREQAPDLRERQGSARETVRAAKAEGRVARARDACGATRSNATGCAGNQQARGVRVRRPAARSKRTSKR